jgi:WD40-like Beta Propeller Repeat
VRRSLAPYAIGAALVFVVSIAVLAGALAMGGLLDERIVAPDASPTASAVRAPVELSRAGRLAYWRTDPSGDTQLWVSNVDGSGRRAIANVDSLSRVQATRWSPDGSSIAWLDQGVGVVVQQVDGVGARYDLPLPQSALATNARLIDLDWSTDSSTLAATLRGSTQGTPNTETDVYVVAATGGDWRNVTVLGNAFLSQWISPTEILIHTGSGLIAVQRVQRADDPGLRQLTDDPGLTPLTGLVATSPFVGDDGRVYFFAGQVAPTIRDATVPVINAGQARVWSMTIDGGDVRQEIQQPYDDVRLVAQWSPGRFVVHQGASTALAFLTSSQPIATIPGVIDRVVFSPDRRTAIGVSATRIVRYDTARPESPVVLLSDVAQPDAWYPETLRLARAPSAPAVVAPAARYVFVLHGLLWASDPTGRVRLLRPLAPDDGSISRLSGMALPQWSPHGDLILVFDVSRFRGSVFVTDVAGFPTRLSDQDAAGPFPTWSPDGNAAFTALIGSFDSAGFGADGEVRVVNLRSLTSVATYHAREIAFGGGKTYLIDNGKLDLPLQTRTDHSILEATPSGTRIVTTAAQLSVGTQFGAAQGLQLSMLGASADGAFLSARLSPPTGSVGFIFTVFRAADGGPTLEVPGQDVADIRWSPNGHLVGMTLANIPVVRDAETTSIVASATSGRFAGWSPDGKWFYVARETGLYAQMLTGGDPVRISSLGVPVSATTP